MSPRAAIALAVTALVLGLVTQAGAKSGAPAGPGTRAQAYGLKLQLPSQQPIVAGALEGPPNVRRAWGAFAYPEDGSIVRADSVTSRAFAASARALAGADLRRVTLFGGELTADAVVARSEAVARDGAASGDFGATSITNLVVLGQPVAVATDARVPLGDWGHAVLLEERALPDEPGGVLSHRGWVTALDVWLDAEHAGLPAGTRILIGYAEASTRAPAAVKPAPRAPKPVATGAAGRAAVPVHPRITRGLGLPPDVPRPGTKGPPPLVLLAGSGLKITAGGYVFPVHGPAGFGSSFGAPRADVEWHHGEDIFAPLGAPILAVADGTLFSVGRNELGGNRLWLRDRQGNEFYYAHLSAFSPLAVNGARVAAGDVIGFVGNTGDADGTPYHLHFEIHPASLLFLGEDGVVDPGPYLRAWQHLEDIDFPSAAVWAPTLVATGRAPEPGAILLQVSDISGASGLEPGSLARALAPLGERVALSDLRPRRPRARTPNR